MNVRTNVHPTATCRMYNHDCSHNIPFYYIYICIAILQPDKMLIILVFHVSNYILEMYMQLR